MIGPQGPLFSPGPPRPEPGLDEFEELLPLLRQHEPLLAPLPPDPSGPLLPLPGPPAEGPPRKKFEPLLSVVTMYAW